MQRRSTLRSSSAWGSAARASWTPKREFDMNGMMDMGWGMGLIGLLVLVLLVLGIAALVKYLLSK